MSNQNVLNCGPLQPFAACLCSQLQHFDCCNKWLVSRLSLNVTEIISSTSPRHADLYAVWTTRCTMQRSTSNDRSERRSSQEYAGQGRLLVPGAAAAAAASSSYSQQQSLVQRQQQLLPQLGSKSVSKKDIAGSGREQGKLSSAAEAAGVYHTDDNGVTGYAGGW
jgi:hypothetical protein